MDEDQSAFDDELDRSIEFLDSLYDSLIYGGTLLEPWQRRSIIRYVKHRLQAILDRIDGGDRLGEP